MANHHYRRIWAVSGTLPKGVAELLQPENLKTGFYALSESNAMILMHDGSVWEVFRGEAKSRAPYARRTPEPEDSIGGKLAMQLKSDLADLDRAAEWLFSGVVVARYEPKSLEAKAIRLRVDRGETP